MRGWYSLGCGPALGRARRVSWHAMLLVFGPRSTDFDFGPGHPLTPRRFGPGIDLLRAVGAEPGLAPEPAADEELLWCHTRRYLDVVKRFSVDPFGFPEVGHRRGRRLPAVRRDARGVGGGGRRVASGGRGDPARGRRARPAPGRRAASRDAGAGVGVLHLRRPGAGDRPGAAGRTAGDVHRPRCASRRRRPGDPLGRSGRADDLVPRDRVGRCSRGPATSTRSGRASPPGPASTCRCRPGPARGRGWLPLSLLLPELAATFAPDLIVSQHGADSHAWDPLAHLNVTTTAHGRGGAARRHASRIGHARGRWLATGGGGYDAYRVVPRTWALTWLAGAHREVPDDDARRPGASDGRPRRHGTGRRRSPSGSTTSRMPGSSSTPRRRPRRSGRPGSRRSSGACSCRASCRSGTTAAGGIRSRPRPTDMPGAAARASARRRSSPTSTPRPGRA